MASTAPRLASARPQLFPGDPAPWFRAPALDGNPDYAINTVAGRNVLMLFFGSAAAPGVADALALVTGRHRALFDDGRACFFGVTIDPQDAPRGRIAQSLPGIRYLLDHDRAASALYGACDAAADAAGGVAYEPFWLVLDPALQVVGRLPLPAGEQAVALLAQLRAPDDQWAPVLSIPNVFEPALCRRLIDLYEAKGGEDSGFMREVDGKTVRMIDHSHKRRADVDIDDERLRRQLAARIQRRVAPMVHRAFQFEATRMERYIVACYEAEHRGHFRPHRDNTTGGTAHRRFAVTINLNAEDYDGGELRFPEYGGRRYRASTGGAIVFSCSLLHEATPVTRGRRYAFLPFLYDEAAARLREANNGLLGEGVGAYRA